MTRVIEFLISLLIVVALFVAVALFLPSKRSFTHSVETNRPMATTFDLLNGFGRFNDWNQLRSHDPRMQMTPSGPASGVGAKLSYQSSDRAVGSGTWEIIESEPGELIRFKVDDSSRGSNKTVTLRFERTGPNNRNVKITQRYSVTYGWDILGRYAGMYVTRNVGDNIKRGMGKLISLLATIPKFDYSIHPTPIEFVDMPAVDVLVAPSAAKRDNDAIALAMSNQMGWIKKVMEANGLESAGPMRIVTTEFTSESYSFDVVQPVKKLGSTGVDAPLTVKVEGPVIYAQLPATRAVSTVYNGPAPGLERERQVVRAWAIVRGAEPQDRPFEEYGVDISRMLADDAKFTVYWPVK